MRQILSEFPYIDEEEKAALIGGKTEEYYKECLLDPKFTLLIAQSDTSAVGVLEARLEENSQNGTLFGFVRWVGVDSKYRGQGIGKELYTEYEDRLSKQGVSYMVAGVDHTNLSSRALHAKCGFDMDNLYASNETKSWYYKKIH